MKPRISFFRLDRTNAPRTGRGGTIAGGGGLRKAAVVCAVCAGMTLAEVEDLPKPPSWTEHAIRGWTVRVDVRLLRPPDDALGTAALARLESKLADIACVVAPDRLAKLQAVPIVLDLSHGRLRPMGYHPNPVWLETNGYDRALAKCVHIPRAADLLTPRTAREQPWVVLHELAHAYHDQVLGYGAPRILEAYERFKQGGRGELALRHDGKPARHYALTNSKEFFAEMTEAYFGMNDFFPFNRAELMTAEPDIFALMLDIWGPVAGTR